jgi:predicted membrane-bound spermidine synthase
MQRLILLLGHPIYSLVVILFTLLLAGGLGSLFARRFEAARIRAALGLILPAVAGMIVAAAFVLPAIVHAAMPLGLYERIAIAGLLTFPFGFLMGMPFPLGLRRLSQDPAGAPASVLWGINGVASVVGSIGGVALAVVGGFTSMFLLAAGCYAVALATRPR